MDLSINRCCLKLLYLVGFYFSKLNCVVFFLAIMSVYIPYFNTNEPIASNMHRIFELMVCCKIEKLKESQNFFNLVAV